LFWRLDDLVLTCCYGGPQFSIYYFSRPGFRADLTWALILLTPISGHLGLTLFDRTGPDLMTSTDLFGTGLDLPGPGPIFATVTGCGLMFDRRCCSDPVSFSGLPFSDLALG
jgi:hypothetical protein